MSFTWAFRITVVVACCLVAPDARPDTLDHRRGFEDYARQSWRMTDGLPQESVTSLLQSRDGYLWFGTLDGLVRFDGVRFEVINLIRRAGMESNAVLALTEARDGSLWIGTRDGIARYHGGRFTVYGRDQGLTDTMIRCLIIDPEGVLWIGTRAGGINRIDTNTGALLARLPGLDRDDVRAILIDRNGAIWLARPNGAVRLRDKQRDLVRLAGASPAVTLLSFVEDASGTVWIGTTEGVWRMSADGNEAPAPPVLPDRQTRALAAAPDGTIWVGTTVGLARVRGEEIVEDRPFGREYRVDARSLLIDREGSVWFGSDGAGLHRLREASVTMVKTALGPDSNTLMSLLEDPDGTIWMAANCGGVVQWDNGTARAFTTADGLPDDCTRSLAVDPKGGIWVGTVAGMAKIERGRVTRRLTVKEGLHSNRVMSILADRNGAVWAGTSEAGLDRIEGGRITNYGTRTGLTSDDVRALLEGRDGSIWAGTYGAGLWRIKDGTVTTITRRDGLSNSSVLALLEDPDGTLWIGTNGGGLNRLRNGRITVFTMAQGLYSDGIFQILDDGRGALWMGSNRGVFRVSREDLEAVGRGSRPHVSAVSFTASDGLQPGGAMGGAQPAGWRDRAGRLWFPTVTGAAVIDPKRLVRNPVPPMVHVEAVLVDRQPRPTTGVIELPPGSRQVEFHYTAPSFAAPDKVRFRYRLDGYEGVWVDVGTRRAAYFTNLAPASYRFRVEACNNDGVWSETEASLDFVVLPFFYQTRWFQALVLFGVLALGAAGYVVRVRGLRSRERALARQVDEALAQLKVLSGMLPTCASCKRIRDDDGEWRQMEAYIRQHSQADFSHGICPDCMQRLYPDFVEKLDS